MTTDQDDDAAATSDSGNDQGDGIPPRQLFPHPLTDTVPPMDQETYGRLKASIAGMGKIINPITLYEGQILDGRYRYRACIELGIEPTFEEYDEIIARGPYRGGPVDFVRSANFMRKHLTKEEIAEIEERIAAYQAQQVIRGND